MSFKENSQITVLQMFGHTAVSGDIGIEIELEGTGPLGVACKGWSTHAENSLRAQGGSGPGGTEYVTRGAIKENDVISMVEKLATVLTSHGCVINPDAHRTSTHIHVNVQKLTMIEVLGYITIFTAVEPLLLALCGGKRDGNSFCASSYETGDLPEFFNIVCKQIDAYQPGYGGIDAQRGKYAALGTFRLHDLGTLEARCFPHSVDAEEIHKWCQWLLRIREIAQAETDKSYRQIIKQGIHDPLMLIARVFGIHYLPVSHNLQNELVSYGSQEAYELTRLLKRYLNKPAREKKEKQENTLYYDGIAPNTHHFAPPPQVVETDEPVQRWVVPADTQIGTPRRRR